jgi:hypothetical protein
MQANLDIQTQIEVNNQIQTISFGGRGEEKRYLHFITNNKILKLYMILLYPHLS